MAADAVKTSAAKPKTIGLISVRRGRDVRRQDRLNSSAGHETFDDGGEVGADLSQAVEIVLALTARGNDSTVTEQGQVMADGRLALAELGAKSTDVLFAIGEDQDYLEPGRVADVLQENRGTLGLVGSLISGLDGLGLRRGFGGGSLRGRARLRCHLRNLSNPEARHAGVNDELVLR